MAGAYSYVRLGQAEDPDFTFKVMVVRTLWPGATAREVEQQVTERLEKKLQETPWFDYTRSYSKPGESLIFVLLKDYTPPKEVPNAWYQVRKKLATSATRCRPGVQGPFLNDEFGDTFGTIYAFTSDGYSFAELRDYVDRVRNELLRVPDVAKIDLIGDQDEKIYVEMSHRKLATLGIDPLADLQRAAEAEQSGAGGQLRDQGRPHLRARERRLRVASRASARSASRRTAGCSVWATSPRSIAATSIPRC